MGEKAPPPTHQYHRQAEETGSEMTRAGELSLPPSVTELRRALPVLHRDNIIEPTLLGKCVGKSAPML